MSETKGLVSMTGYARIEGRADDGTAWVWDLRSVNGKSLDARLRLPPGCEALEKPVRERLAQAAQRGSVSISLSLARPVAASGLSINRAWLETLIQSAAETLAGHPGAVAPPSFDGLLQVKGVIETAEAPPEDGAEAVLHARLLADFDSAASALAAARAEEGARLAAVVADHIDTIAGLVDAAAACEAARADTRKARLARAVADLLETTTLPEDRLTQELALLVTRFDVREELDRLASHIAAARALLAEASGIGRKFDFLCQEFNREANTLCSKSADAALTAVGLELKTVIDRLREQIQNIE